MILSRRIGIRDIDASSTRGDKSNDFQGGIGQSLLHYSCSFSYFLGTTFKADREMIMRVLGNRDSTAPVGKGHLKPF